MRVVIDTNVVISAALKPNGNEARVISLSRRGVYALCVSDELEKEYREVSQRKKFAKYAQDLVCIVDEMVAHSLRIPVVDKPSLCSDPDDDVVLGCALHAMADYLVTGNLVDFPKHLEKPAIVNAKQFLETVET